MGEKGLGLSKVGQENKPAPVLQKKYDLFFNQLVSGDAFLNWADFISMYPGKKIP